MVSASSFSFEAKASNHDWNAGAAFFRATIEWNFNFKVDGIVTTNLLRMPGVIDAIGGVTVLNPNDVYDETYPTPDYGVKEILYPEGELRPNGEQALEFSRTRHMDGDNARIFRQHLVLSAALGELQKLENLTKIPAIVDAGRQVVMTDIPADGQGYLIARVPDMNPDLVAWGTVVEFPWGETLADGGWNHMTDWTYLPYHVRAWLGVGYFDINRY